MKERVPVWEQRQALANWLWERGPMTAKYTGELSDKVATVLNKALKRNTPFTQNNGSALINEMLKLGEVVIEGTTQKPTKLTYVGQDPALVDWNDWQVRPPRVDDSNCATRGDEVELLLGLNAALEDRIGRLEQKVHDLEQNLQLKVNLAISEAVKVVRRERGEG